MANSLLAIPPFPLIKSTLKNIYIFLRGLISHGFVLHIIVPFFYPHINKQTKRKKVQSRAS